MIVEIEYCDACGGLGMAVEVRDRIRASCGDAVDDVEVTPVTDGAFRVHADDEELFTTDRAAYDPGRIVTAVCRRVT